MYIKIVRQKVRDVPYREYLHECESFSIVTNEKGITMIFNPYPYGDLKTRSALDVDPLCEEIYIMNNEGKTIDYYTWNHENPVDEETKEQL